jgi:hypothetical protein
MPRAKPEQAEHSIPKLRELGVELGGGKTVAEAVKRACPVDMRAIPASECG